MSKQTKPKYMEIFDVTFRIVIRNTPAGTSKGGGYLAGRSCVENMSNFTASVIDLKQQMKELIDVHVLDIKHTHKWEEK